jgi:hypothetical protein
MCDQGGGCCHGENEEIPNEMGIQFSLYSKIDTENLQCLNEVVDNSGKTVFKSWEHRLCKFKVSVCNFCPLLDLATTHNFHLLLFAERGE